jgi:uncharacterized protein YhaN
MGDFLFGIPPRSSDNQLHSYADMRLGAVLVDGDGGRYELIRRKGARSTLLGPDGQPADLDGASNQRALRGEVITELVKNFKRVTGKKTLLRKIAGRHGP